MIASFAATIALFTITLLAPVEAQQPPEDPKALAEFLMAKNAESMNALASISYEFTETYEQHSRKKQPYHDKRTGTFRRSWFGEFLELNWGAPHEDVKGNDLGTFARTDRYVVNLEYAARWTVDALNPANIFYRDDKGALSKRAEALMSMYGHHRPHLFAFGPGERALKEELLSLSAKMKYEATARRLGDAKESKMFELEWGYVHPKNNGRVTPTHRFTLDGDRGYLVTHGESFYRPGINMIEWNVALAQSEKVWYPKTISHTRWDSIKHPATQPSDMKVFYRFKTEISEMKVDQKFNDRDFQFVALGMPDGNVICKEGENDEPISFYVAEEELISTEQADGTGLEERYHELMQQRAEAARDRKPIVPASQPSR